MRSSHCAMALALLLLGATTVHADEGRLSVGAGVDYSSGKYGTATATDIWSVPLNAGWQDDRWTLKLTVPYIGISGSDNVIPGTGGVNNGNPRGRGRGGSAGGDTTTGRGSASGLGDIVASAGYAVFSSADRTAGLDLTGKVKFATADEDKGLGTGKNDYGLALDAYKAHGAWTVFGGVGWMKYGSSQYIRLQNGFNANLGVGLLLSETDDVGAYYYYREKIAEGGAAQSEVTAYWNHRIGAHWRVQGYVLGGLADGSPDWGAGATAKYLF
jgi:hypothetical protein